MTIRPSSASDPFAHDAAFSVTSRPLDDGPYARPASIPPRQAVDAVLIDAIRASVGPFVPAPWRMGSSVATVTTPVAASPIDAPSDTRFNAPSDTRFDAPSDTPSEQAVVLPWIEAFLDTDEGQADAMAERAVHDTAGTVDSSEVAAEFDVADPASLFAEAAAPEVETEVRAVVDAAGEAELASSVADAESAAEGEVASSPADEWPLEEAGAAMRALADDLTRHDETPGSRSEADGAVIEPPVASTPPLPVWGDDDMMDIMPVRTSPPAPDGEHWAERARRETEHAASPESAALALEALARRVRSGELPLSGFSPGMGEAAALAAALAALLSVRR